MRVRVSEHNPFYDAFNGYTAKMLFIQVMRTRPSMTIYPEIGGMKTLSPAEERTKAMTKIYTYIVVTMTVKQTASMASLLAILSENKSIELIDHDEATRRVILRAQSSEAGYLELLVNRYASAASFEVKASMKKNIKIKDLARLGAKYVSRKRLLFYWSCNGGAVFGEQKPRSRILLKYCREATGIDPAMMPYSLCSFNPFEQRIASILEKARQCFTKFVNKLGQKGSSSTN